MRENIKKIISIMLSVIMGIAIISQTEFLNVRAEGGVEVSQNTAKIYSDELTVSAGEKVTIPIIIHNNIGLMGFAFDISYDEDVLEPVSVKSSDMTASGLLNDSIDTSTKNMFKVCWAGDTNIIEDGILFYITFSVSEFARGSNKVRVKCRQDETFNEEWKDVKLECEDIVINVIKPQISTVYLSSDDNMEVDCGKEIAVPISIYNNINTDSVSFDLKYDQRAFGFNFAEKSFEGTYSIEEIDDGIHVEIHGIEADNKLLTLYFNVADYIGDNYRFLFENTEINAINFSIKVNNTHENEETIIYGDYLSVKGDILTVPVMIKNNKGLMGYKITLYYDAECLEPVDIMQQSGFDGNFFDNIGVYSGKYSILWSANENIVQNGILFTSTFRIKNENAISKLEIEYSPEDTFNEKWEDVNWICKDIEVDISKIKGEEITNNETTTVAEITNSETTTVGEKTTVDETTTLKVEGSTADETTTSKVDDSTVGEITTSDKQSIKPVETTIKKIYPTITSRIKATSLFNFQNGNAVPTYTYDMGVLNEGKGGMLTIPVEGTAKAGKLVIEVKTSVKVRTIFVSDYKDMQYGLAHANMADVGMNIMSNKLNYSVKANQIKYIHIFDEQITKPIKVQVKVYEYTRLNTKLRKVKNLKGRKASLKWKKVKGISGYEIQISMNKKFTKKVKLKKVKAKVTKNIVKKLKKNKKYYFRIRTVKKIGSVTIYGVWSKMKKLKIKK